MDRAADFTCDAAGGQQRGIGFHTRLVTFAFVVEKIAGLKQAAFQYAAERNTRFFAFGGRNKKIG